jgi:hypothetical protein
VNLITTQGLAMHDTKVIPLHRATQVPITVDGPYTKDCQEHHDFEDGLSIAIARAHWVDTSIRRTRRASLAIGVAVFCGYWGGRALGAW